MDERPKVEFANYLITLSNQKRNVRTRMQVPTVHHNNGTFMADSETIGFVAPLLNYGKTSAILIDTKDNPIEIDNLEAFRDILFEAYAEASFEYKTQMEKIQRARNIKKLMDW